MPEPEPVHSDEPEEGARLRAWADDLQLSNRLGVPYYEGPSALKAAVRDVLDELRLARERDKHARAVIIEEGRLKLQAREERDFFRRDRDLCVVHVESLSGEVAALRVRADKLTEALRSEVSKRHWRVDGRAKTEADIDLLVEAALQDGGSEAASSGE